MENASIHTLVVGGGVIGLAIARELALRGQEVALVEQHPFLGQETTSRNSGVIHAGIYYPTNSLKAKLCVQGRRLLYDYCQEKDIPHQKIGKIIVATTPTQQEKLHRIHKQGLVNDVEGLELIGPRKIRALESDIVGLEAILSHQTGIIDVHSFLKALEADFLHHGGMLVKNAAVQTYKRSSEEHIVHIQSDTPYTVQCRTLINAAGLHATKLANLIHENDAHWTPMNSYFAKGHYFSLSGAHNFNRLIYPIPETGGLGVHLTLDLGGAARFGPDVQWTDKIDYSFDESRKDTFIQKISTYWPAVLNRNINPDYTGIRPKLVGQGEPAADFKILSPEHHKISGVVHCLGIESPGLTAALAIAGEVAGKLG
ncbi:MAG: NAD(P)/FAD-dependent oxidoreductase [Myxococcota bacterium]|nr:NAD(P)/FAD-dependent oxidoreductase [Myxococcota bacterium]